MPAAATRPSPSASHYLGRVKPRISQGAYKDLRWRLQTAVDHLGPLALAETDEAAIEDLFVAEALKQRDAIERAAAQGSPLTEVVEDHRGRRYEGRRRGLHNSSINKVLAAINRVMKDATRRGPIERNPAADPDLRVRVPKQQRSFLEVHQVAPVVSAARILEDAHRGLTWAKARYIRRSNKPAVALAKELGVSDVLVGKVRRGILWAEEREPRNRNDIARHAILATLVMAGLRVSELCGLRGEHIDLTAGRISIT